MAQPHENMEAGGGPGEVNARRSDVWTHFVISKDGDGKDIATCKNCNKSLVGGTKNGTTHLKRHIEKSCPRVLKQPRLSLQSGEPSSNNTLMNLQEECTAELAQMITFHGYPSSIVENESFGSFVRCLNPRFQMPSRAAIEGICHDRAKDSMNQLKETLVCCPGQISLVTGTIETDQGRALYMAGQFIDDEWAFQKRIMQVFKVVIFAPDNHSSLQGAEEICLQIPEKIQKKFSLQSTSSKIGEAVRSWGLKGRLFSVAWDQELRERLERKNFLDGWSKFSSEVLCVAYTSNVLDSVAATFLEGLNPNIEVACLKASKDLHLSHEKRAQYFSELGLHHIRRYRHRWYSYYCALEVLHKEYSENNASACTPQAQQEVLKNQFVELINRQTFGELQDKIGMLLGQPRFQESVFTELLRKILGTIYRAIETISSPNRPTSNICLVELMSVIAVLDSEATDLSLNLYKVIDHATIGGFIPGINAGVVLQEAYGTLVKFVHEAYLNLSIPTVLDPRFKLGYLSTVFKVVFQSEAEVKISSVKEAIEGIFDMHRRKLRNVILNNGEGTSRMAAEMGTGEMDIDGYLQEGITELERYLTDDLVPQEEGEAFDVLMWWKDNSCSYPTVASMARDALAMPASDMLSADHIARIRSMMSSYCLTYPEAPSED